MKKLSCLIIDDEKGPRERLAILLGKMDEIHIAGICAIPEDATRLVLEKEADLVFIDVEMPRLTGFDIVKQVKEERPLQTFIFVTGYNQYAIKAIKNEAFDFLVKPVDIDELKQSLARFRKRIFTRNSYSIDKKLLNHLSDREIEILKLIAQHKTAQEIANELHLSKHTIDTHRRNILDKTQKNKTSELVVLALECGLGE